MEHQAQVDPLLDCLLFFSKMHGKNCSRATLVGGLPLVENKVTPTLFIQAAKRVDLKARIIKRPLTNIPELVLPCVVILKNNQACVLTKVDQNKIAEIALPDSGMGTSKITIADLEKNYSGYVIFVKPTYEFEQRTREFHEHQPKSWFWGTLWQYRIDYIQLLVAAFLINIFVVVSPLYVMNVYDRVIPNNAIETLWVLALGVFIIYTFDFVIKAARTYVIETFGKKIDTQIARRLFAHTLGIRLAYKPASAGAFASNLRDFEMLRDFFTSATIVSLIDIPFIFVFVTVIALIGGSLAVIPLVAMPIVIAVASLVRLPLANQTEVSMQCATQKNAIVVEALYSTEAIKSLGAEGQWQTRWEEFTAKAANAAQKMRQLSMGAANFTSWIIQLVTVVIVIVGVYKISSGSLSMGGLIAAVILGPRCLAPLAQITMLLTRYNHAKSSLQGLNRIFKLPIDRPGKKTFLQRPTLNGEIRFDDVTFKYPNETNAAIERISFNIKPGEKIGLIGPLGAGKSTILKLILGFYHPDHGKIYLDGTDMEQIDPADIRRNIAYAPQEAALFYASIKDNILLGRPWVDDNAFVRAIEYSGVEKLIRSHPKGLDMPISERGDSLSGGQRQTVALARVFLTDSKMVLLDEPTNNMDDASELHVINSINKFSQGKTLILSTHKLSMLSIVDRLIVIEGGKIIADGPKEEILAALKKNQEARNVDQKEGSSDHDKK